MSYEATVYNKLNADSTLLALLTGGVYHSETMKQTGINRTNMPTAFDSNGFLKPMGVIVGRSVIPIQSIKTPSTGHRVVQQTVEVYLYGDADAGYSTLESAKNRVVTLLDMKPMASTFAVQLTGEQIFRETPLNNACAMRIDFKILGKR